MERRGRRREIAASSPSFALLMIDYQTPPRMTKNKIIRTMASTGLTISLPKFLFGVVRGRRLCKATRAK